MLNRDNEYGEHCNLGYHGFEAVSGGKWICCSDDCKLIAIITKDKTFLPDLPEVE
jgi:hypothetical protein